MFRRPKRPQEDFNEEIHSHLELEGDDLKEEGIGAEEALRSEIADCSSETAAVVRPAFSILGCLVAALGKRGRHGGGCGI